MPETNELVRLPEWLRRPPGSVKEANNIKRLLRKSKLNTVCEEARCPNISECFSQGTATFMILGDVCTRGCRFCSVNTGKPLFNPDSFEYEAENVADAAEQLGLSYVVVTSVARDDLKDGGASGFSLTIRALKRRLPHVKVEVLIPDLRGNWDALKTIVDEAPDVLNHNLETVPRLYRKVRPGAKYERSLELLVMAKKFSPKIQTKSGIMLGLGEESDEVFNLMKDTLKADVDIFTAGQYLRPAKKYLPVYKYLEPSEFDEYKLFAQRLGFKSVFVGPLVRSSYHASDMHSNSC